MDKPSPHELASLYGELGSITALARHLGRPYPTVRYWLVKAGIEIKRTGFRSPKTKRTYGVAHHNWKGGTYMSLGYVLEYAPGHPSARKGYVPRHRLVMERVLGRHLARHEHVHHINGVKTDNRPENLRLLTASAHQRIHKAEAPRDAKGRFAGPTDAEFPAPSTPHPSSH